MGHSLIKLVVVCVALTGGMTFEARPQQRPDIDVATPEGLPAIGR
jgi:hypothetical protein